MPSIFTVSPITYNYPYESNSSISVPSLKLQFEQLKLWGFSHIILQTKDEIPVKRFLHLPYSV